MSLAASSTGLRGGRIKLERSMARRMTAGRICATPGCGTRLSVYNSEQTCRVCTKRAEEARIKAEIVRERARHARGINRRERDRQDDVTLEAVLRKVARRSREGWIKTTQLCRVLDTDDRQRVRNSIVRLQKRGVPIVARREQGGGYRLQPMTRKPKCDIRCDTEMAGPRSLVYRDPARQNTHPEEVKADEA
jgi:biotin operon repressor